MPLYSYQCDKCMLEFDRFRPAKDRKTHACPECGEMAHKILSTGFSTSVDTKYRDLCGTQIWFPRDGRPYYDKYLKKTFNTIKEKQDFMKEKRLVMDGSESSKWTSDSGDMKNKSYRREMKLED